MSLPITHFVTRENASQYVRPSDRTTFDSAAKNLASVEEMLAVAVRAAERPLRAIVAASEGKALTFGGFRHHATISATDMDTVADILTAIDYWRKVSTEARAALTLWSNGVNLDTGDDNASENNALAREANSLNG